MSERDRSGEKQLFVFATTHHALWAEDVARERDIPADVVPAPPDSGAQCGLALRTAAARATELQGALDQEGVPYVVLT